MTNISCRNCGAVLTSVFADLGASPLANRLLREEELGEPEPHYPLKALVCDQCLLVQLGEYATPDSIFSDYVYFSSYSESFLRHCERYADEIAARLSLTPRSKVVEVASNDGYLLRFFANRGIDVLGIEPAENVAQHAIDSGIPTITEFFGASVATRVAEEIKADLLIGNNVLAHVPHLHDFVEGLRILLADNGVLTMEFPHIFRLIEEVQFDTIYHEHFSYFSLHVIREVLGAHDLTLFDVEEISVHGGSLRIYAAHRSSRPNIKDRVDGVLAREVAAGLTDVATYTAFGAKVPDEKRRLLSILIDRKDAGHQIAAYGAPAKGNTLLNYCGIGTDMIDFTVDTIPDKQGRYLPGSRIPVLAPAEIEHQKPDLVFILPWNLREEITPKLAPISQWGGKVLVRMPEFVLLDPAIGS